MEGIMNGLLTMTVLATFVLGGAVTAAAEPPTYELGGFPITPHQSSVVGSPSVQERSPTPSLILDGVPASPHQVAVLRLHPEKTQRQVANK
jgi:hypothetical protein